MPSRSFSKAASRKNNARVFGAFLTFTAALIATPVAGQSLTLEASSGPQGIRATVSFQWNKESELVSSVRDGMEARIVFTLRVYQKNAGFLPFLRDKLLKETRVARSAFWDFLDRKFVVESDDGTRSNYDSPSDLLSGFLSLRDFPLSRLPARPGEQRYVTARALLEPVRLMPPLTIVTLAGAAATYTTPWERRDLP